jgi:hypothetical protein
MNTRAYGGKASELIVAGELIRRGLDVYMPTIDIKGVDLIVRTGGEGRGRFYEVQVKSVGSYTRVVGLQKARVRRKWRNYFLVLHYRLENRDDEFYYLSKQQLLRLLPPKSQFGDLVFNRPERAKYRKQDLTALAKLLRSGNV